MLVSCPRKLRQTDCKNREEVKTQELFFDMPIISSEGLDANR